MNPPRRVTLLARRATVLVKQLVDGVNRGSQEQTLGIEEISHAFTQIERVSQASAAGAEESASASQQLDSQSRALSSVVIELRSLVGGDTAAYGA